MPTGEGGCWREHPQKGIWMAMPEWPPAHPEEADRMPFGKREGAGWRNPKVVRLEERRTQKGKATFFRSMSGRGLTDPRTSPCRLWGCPKKVSAEQYEARHSLRFREMSCASSQKPLSEAWAVLRVKE